MTKLSDEHFTKIDECPWCGSPDRKLLYRDRYDAGVQECAACHFVYADRILNELGLQLYWLHYLSEVHNKSGLRIDQRHKMYEIESELIRRFIDCDGKNVLDVGCGNGDFLDCFKRANANCFGVEYGLEAATAASKKYEVWHGEFPNLEIRKTFDLIIFRGSLQYCISPKSYLKKAMDLLNSRGLLYITSTPNTESICFRLFKENFTVPVCATDYYGFHEAILTEYLQSLHGKLLCSHHFYQETPYANIYNDIAAVAEAVSLCRQNKPITFRSPPFFDNMLTLVYQKCE